MGAIMQQVSLDYGDGKMEVELPDSATVVVPGVMYQDPPEVDPWESTRQALARPLGMPPLKELAGPGKRVVIAFPDKVKGGTHATSHRQVSIPLIVEELTRAGVERENISLVCAIGLHRKNPRSELYEYLGRDIVDAFWPDRLLMHDAEDPAGIVDLGTDEMGNVVQVNRRVAEADLAILIGHVQGNPYGGYSGGYKMLVTGLTSWPCIQSHHQPGTMHRHDFLPASTTSHMRRQFDSIGRTIEERVGATFFAVDAVLGTQAQVLGVYAGALDEVQRASWPLAEQRTNVTVPSAEPYDILVYGLPRSFHYGPGMGTNPILMLQAIAAQLTRCYGVFRPGGVIIAPSVCDGWFNEAHFGCYRKTYEKLQQVTDFADVFAHEPELTADAEAIFRYREHYAYHPGHALSMVSMGAIAHQQASAVFIPGAKAPGYARGMGCIPTKTFADALDRARRHVGKKPRILAIPGAYSGGAAVNLRPG
jgi:nickel-dependent lactate racemase